MQSVKVKDLMVPLHEYTTVSQDATLGEALVILENAQKEIDPSRSRHRIILVDDMNKDVVGETTIRDILRVLEPQDRKLPNIGVRSSAGYGEESSTGYGEEFMKVIEELPLWTEPLKSICVKATKLKVRDIMYVPSDVEYVDDCATLADVVHQVLGGDQHFLFTMRDNRIMGILRRTDVFRKIREKAKDYEICLQMES